MRAATSLLMVPLTFAITGTGAPAGAQTRTVETTVHVAASPERVLRSFINAEDLEGWWNTSRSLVEAKPGGIWAVSWDDYGEEKTQHAWAGVVEEMEAGRLRIGHLVMFEPDRPVFGPLKLEIVVVPANGGTSLTVLHRGYRSGEDWDWMHDTVVAGWRKVLGDLQRWFQRPH